MTIADHFTHFGDVRNKLSIIMGSYLTLCAANGPTFF